MQEEARTRAWCPRLRWAGQHTEPGHGEETHMIADEQEDQAND